MPCGLNDLRFVVVDDDPDKRCETSMVVKSCAPKSEILEFSHPYNLKLWLKKQRDAGVQLSAKPTLFIGDGSMDRLTKSEKLVRDTEIISSDSEEQAIYGDYKTASTKAYQYRDFHGLLKVLGEFQEYLGNFMQIEVSGGVSPSEEFTVAKLVLSTPTTRNSSSYNKTNFGKDKLEVATQKFLAALSQ
jgi:hypothetical protein